MIESEKTAPSGLKKERVFFFHESAQPTSEERVRASLTYLPIDANKGTTTTIIAPEVWLAAGGALVLVFGLRGRGNYLVVRGNTLFHLDLGSRLTKKEVSAENHWWPRVGAVETRVLR